MKKKPIYKALSFFLSLCLIAATITVPAFAAGETLAIQDPGAQTVIAGDSVNIPITVTPSGFTNNDAVTPNVTVASLPRGLEYQNGVITGTTTQTGVHSITINASAMADDGKTTINANPASFEITVSALTLSFDSAAETLTEGVTGVNYTGTFAAAKSNSQLQQIAYAKGTSWVSGFDINGTTITASNPTQGTHELQVKASVGGVEATKTITIEIADPEISWNPSSTTLAPGVVGNNYEANIAGVAGTNGTGNVTFEANQQDLPAGLSLNTAGVLSGTPTAAVNEGSFVVTAKASNAADVSKTFTITIADRFVTLDQPSDQVATVDTKFTSAAPSVDTNTGKKIGYAISVTGKANQLPTGLMFNSTSGVIEGTIEAANGKDAEGEYDITLTASAGESDVSDSKTFKLTVKYPRVEVVAPIDDVAATATNTIATIDAGAAFNNTTGVDAEYAMTGNPKSLSINTKTGEITGALTMGDLDSGAAKTHNVQVTATADGKTATDEFTITVNPPAFVDAPTTIDLQRVLQGKTMGSIDLKTLLGSTYNGGDTLDYSFTVTGTSGATTLPSGLRFENGVLSGTPANNGNYTFTFKAAGQTSGVETTATFVLEVGERKFTTTTLQDDTLKLGAAYSKDVKDAFEYNDPDATVTYEVAGLLEGLEMKDGVISGKIMDKNLVSDTPIIISVKAMDAANSFPSPPVTFNLTIEGLEFTAFNVPSELTAYAGYNFTNSDINATFEEAGVGLEFSALNLPPNLSINQTTGEITGTIDSRAQETDTAKITVEDQKYGYKESKDINFTVKTPSITITKPDNVTVYEGYAFNDVVVQAAVDVPDSSKITYTVSGLPAGIEFDQATKTIKGTADAGTAKIDPYTVIIKVADGTTTKEETFDITVNASAIKVEQAPGHSIYAGNDVDITLNFVYQGPNTASATVKGLPEGLTYANGKITGVATEAAVKADPYTVEVTLTDGVKTANMSFDITVEAKTEVPPTQKPEELKWDGNTEGATGMEIRFDVHFADFNNQVYVNGKLIRKDTDYTAKEGSTIITLTNSFLKGLNSGTYDVEAVFKNSIGKASVNVVAATPTTTTTTPTTTTGTTTSGNTTTNTTAGNTTDVTVTDPNKPGTDVSGGQTTTESTTPAAGTTTTVTKTDEGDSPKTGDNNALVILIVLTILAGGATMVLYKKRKKA